MHAFLSAATIAFLLIAAAKTAPTPEPPGIPTGSAARSQLADLVVAAQGPQAGYSRELFPHWILVSGSCDTREEVLKRDGSGVVTNAACQATSGSWYSPYDGRTWTLASDLDIDHVVPLSNAWKSGAASWNTSRRQVFANDRNNPQLIAVTDEVNQAKGDKGPEEWKPSQTSYHCTYASMWVRVKYVYGLTITSAEKTALTTMLNTCQASSTQTNTTQTNATQTNSTRTNTTGTSNSTRANGSAQMLANLNMQHLLLSLLATALWPAATLLL